MFSTPSLLFCPPSFSFHYLSPILSFITFFVFYVTELFSNTIFTLHLFSRSICYSLPLPFLIVSYSPLTFPLATPSLAFGYHCLLYNIPVSHYPLISFITISESYPPPPFYFHFPPSHLPSFPCITILILHHPSSLYPIYSSLSPPIHFPLVLHPPQPSQSPCTTTSPISTSQLFSPLPPHLSLLH